MFPIIDKVTMSNQVQTYNAKLNERNKTIPQQEDFPDLRSNSLALFIGISCTVSSYCRFINPPLSKQAFSAHSAVFERFEMHAFTYKPFDWWNTRAPKIKPAGIAVLHISGTKNFCMFTERGE